MSVLLLLDADESWKQSQEGLCQSSVLARFLSLAGHVALRQLVHLEGEVLGEIKRRQRVQEAEREKEKQTKKAKSNDSTSNTTKVLNKVTLALLQFKIAPKWRVHAISSPENM